MDLKVKYMGLELRSPIIVSSSKLTGSKESILHCVKAGAGAVVLKSLFEEQILDEINAKLQENDMYYFYPEAREYVQNISKDHGVNEYLKLIESVKDCGIPVIASINCVSGKEWPEFAAKIQDSGASGIELNIAVFPYDSMIESSSIEKTYVDILREVKKKVNIPVAVKLGNSFTNLPRLAEQLCNEGVDALVLFNRFYTPDIDIERLEIVPQNILSAPEEMSASLRWIGILSSSLKCDLAASTGVHDSRAVIKQILAGAAAVQICSTLYKHGIDYIHMIHNDLHDWMSRHRFASVNEFKGKMSRKKDHLEAFERIQFMKKTTGNY